jgi:cytochrome P450
MDLDLDDPTLFLRDDVLADPRPLYDTLRRRAPVWRLPGQDTYLVADPALIREVVGRPAEFSSNLVSLLHSDGNGCPVGFPVAPLGDPVHVLATADPPVHTRHRTLLQPHLNAAAVGRLEPTLRKVVDERLAPMLAPGGPTSSPASATRSLRSPSATSSGCRRTTPRAWSRWSRA